MSLDMIAERARTAAEAQEKRARSSLAIADALRAAAPKDKTRRRRGPVTSVPANDAGPTSTPT